MKNTTKLTITQFTKFFVSILIPFLLRYLEPAASLSTKTILGVSIFLAWSSLEILHYLRKLETDWRHESELWLMGNDFEIVLNNVRKDYRECVKHFYSKDDLFKDYFDRQFAELARTIQTAAQAKELQVKDYHFQRTDVLLNTFDDGSSGILRLVWIIEGGEPLFDDEWKHYCSEIEKGTKANRIKEIRALIVLDAIAKDHPAILKLAGFYTFTKDHDYRLLDKQAYDYFSRDSHLDNQYVDFGIYGRRYIYRTLNYEERSGSFCKDLGTIDRYTTFFDMAWNSTSSSVAPKVALTKTKLGELFNLEC